MAKNKKEEFHAEARSTQGLLCICLCALRVRFFVRGAGHTLQAEKASEFPKITKTRKDENAKDKTLSMKAGTRKNSKQKITKVTKEKYPPLSSTNRIDLRLSSLLPLLSSVPLFRTVGKTKTGKDRPLSFVFSFFRVFVHYHGTIALMTKGHGGRWGFGGI